MKNQIAKYASDWWISLSIGLSTWVFFGVFYRHHLHYHEQLQLFLTTFDYFSTETFRIGGLANYLSRFIIQFFYDSLVGGFLLALLLVVLQFLLLNVAKKIADKPTFNLLTCLPSLIFAILLYNENALLTGLIASIIVIAVLYMYFRIGNYSCRTIYLIFWIPTLYWMTGIAYLVFFLLCLFIEWTRKERMNRNLLVCVTLLSSLLILGCPVIGKIVFNSQYSAERFWFIGDYFRFINQYQYTVLLFFLSVVIIPLLFKWLPDEKSKKEIRMHQCLQLVLLIIIASFGIIWVADWKKEEVMAYDYYARTKKWNNIIRMADRKSPNGPLTVAALNLALSQKGYLPDYMFSYFQNGVEGLLPSFSKDYMISIMAGEIYYHIGLINTAQRFAFEAMESIPDHQKSVRSIKRLAETNLINGDYALAGKYLKILQNTLFYKNWASETLSYLGNEEYINNHLEWGLLRQNEIKEDALFDERGKEQILERLFSHNPHNHMAYEYLLAYTLLNKDLPHFFEHYTTAESKISYKNIPKSFQEALIYIWSLNSSDQNISLPPYVNPDLLKQLEVYRNIYTTFPNAQQMLTKDFKDTYWYYYHY